MNIFKKQSKELQLIDIEQKISNRTKLVWLEILVIDIERAVTFYENVLGIKLMKNDLFGRKSAFFTNQDAGFNGALIQVSIKSNDNNIRPFFKVEIMYESLKHVNTYGGEIIKAPELLKQEGPDGKILIGANLFDGEIGYLCEVADSEGNKLFLYSHS